MGISSIATNYCNGKLFFRNAETAREKIDNVRYWATAEIATAFVMYAGSSIPKRITSVMPCGFIPGMAIEWGLKLGALFLFAHGAMHTIAANHPEKFRNVASLLKIQDCAAVPNHGDLLENIDSIELEECTTIGKEVDLSDK